MALTKSQIAVLQLLALQRRDESSYFAGDAALNQLLGTGRQSHDLDLFHDTTEALQATWNLDRSLLINNGYTIRIIREAVSFVEADVFQGNDHVRIQWVRDSAFRFFPLISDDLLGTMLHPFDLATNKLLALAGRLEPRDWIDAIECHVRLQPLGFLIWAACGKDPGINPDMLICDASRLHYSQDELNLLDFVESVPSAHDLSLLWKNAVVSAKVLIDLLPEEHLGECLLDKNGQVYTGNTGQLRQDITAGNIHFHKGTLRGVWPEILK